MKKIITLLLLLIVLLLLSSCGNEIEEKTKKYYSTGSVFSGSIELENSYVGYIEGKETVKLSSKVGGRVSELYVKEGDYVKKGSLLAKLDSSEANVGYSSSESAIDILKGLKNTTSKAFDDQISSMEVKIEQLKISDQGIKEGLNDRKKITSSQLETAKVALETAELNLSHTKGVLENKESNIYSNSKDVIVNSVILDTSIINIVDNLLGVTKDNKHKNDDFEDYLSIKDSSKLGEAKEQFIITNKLYLNYKDFYNSEIEGKDPLNEVIIKGLNDGEKLAEEIKILLSLTYEVLDNSVNTTKFPQSTIDSYKNNISELGVKVESSLLTISGDYIIGLKGSLQSIGNLSKEKNMQLDLLNKQVELAQKSYNNYKAISDAEVREVSNKSDITFLKVDDAIIQLSSLKEQKEAKLKELDLKINEAIGQKNTAGVMIQNGEVRSPISGIVTSKMLEVGQVVGAGIPMLTVSDNIDLELNITVSEEQSNNINLYDNVLLEIEGLDKQVNGKITNIDPSKDLITKKVGVEISVASSLPGGEIERGIKIGSFTKVIFNNTSENKGTIISNSAIISKFMIPGVYVLKDGIVVFKNIEIIKQNDSFSEIKGLEIGETIITDGKENIWDGEELGGGKT